MEDRLSIAARFREPQKRPAGGPVYLPGVRRFANIVDLKLRTARLPGESMAIGRDHAIPSGVQPTAELPCRISPTTLGKVGRSV
jgi:hypothetical protein